MSAAKIGDLVPVILAGGSGTRLWPVSRARFPKHLVKLTGPNSMMQETILRVRNWCDGKTLVVGAESQAQLIETQLTDPIIDSKVDLLLEPCARNTAGAVALAAHWAQAEYGLDAVLFVCPSDHLIQAPDALRRAVDSGVLAARQGQLVTFGITPSRPDTGFGYIEIGEQFEGLPDVYAVRQFVEKPPLARAQAMLDGGRHLWNSGMFLMRASKVLGELKRFEPELEEAVRTAFAARDPATGQMTRAAYERVKSTPIDKAVMEQSSDVAVVPCDPLWSDVGTWHALWETLERDKQGNVAQGDVIIQNGNNNLVRAGNRLVVVAGLSDSVVIETEDAVLVGQREDSDSLKQVVSLLTEQNRVETQSNLGETAPWGSVTQISKIGSSTVHMRTLRAGRAFNIDQEGEKITVHVLFGDGGCTIDGKEHELRADSHITFSKATFHASDTGDLVFVEIRRAGSP